MLTGFKEKIEKAAGLAREGAMGDIDGYMAVLLWREYRATKNENALETLVAYNLLAARSEAYVVEIESHASRLLARWRRGAGVTDGVEA